MKRLLTLAVVAAALAVTVGLSGASAFPPNTVGMAGCVFGNGGNATVTAGTPVYVRLGWGAKNHGRMVDFFNAETTAASVNGTPVANPSSYWGPIDSDNVSQWLYPTGITLSPGQSMTVTLDITLDHKIPDFKDPDTGKQVFAGPGSVFGGPITCTITGA